MVEIKGGEYYRYFLYQMKDTYGLSEVDVWDLPSLQIEFSNKDAVDLEIERIVSKYGLDDIREI